MGRRIAGRRTKSQPKGPSLRALAETLRREKGGDADSQALYRHSEVHGAGILFARYIAQDDVETLGIPCRRPCNLHPEKPMTTLNSAIDWFLSHCEHHRKLSPHTLKAYRLDLVQFLSFVSHEGDATQISDVNRDHVQAWLGSMDEARPRTVRRRLATLKSMFACLERQGISSGNPLAGFRCEVKTGISLPRTVARTTVCDAVREALVDHLDRRLKESASPSDPLFVKG